MLKRKKQNSSYHLLTEQNKLVMALDLVISPSVDGERAQGGSFLLMKVSKIYI